MAKVYFLAFSLFITILGHGQNSIEPVRKKVTDIARSQLHVRELTGKNDGKEVEAYLKSTGLGKGYAWCAAFVSWCFHKAGVDAIHSARAADWFKQNLVWKKGMLGQKMPVLKMGQTLGFWYDNLGRIGHIVIVEKDMKTSVSTIGGNTNTKGDREGQGVALKIFPKTMIYAVSDHIKPNL